MTRGEGEERARPVPARRGAGSPAEGDPAAAPGSPAPPGTPGAPGPPDAPGATIARPGAAEDAGEREDDGSGAETLAGADATLLGAGDGATRFSSGGGTTPRPRAGPSELDATLAAGGADGASPAAGEGATLAASEGARRAAPRPVPSGRRGASQGAPSEAPVIAGVELVEEIGRGGMGVVYRGRQSFLEREVAVKVLSPALQGGDFSARFQREARILAGLEHASIVACYHAGTTEEEQCYLVMELIDGPNLLQWIQRNGPQPPARSLGICADVARALAHAHEKRVIHRDVKPANVLLQRWTAPANDPGFPYRAKLVDLGLARPARTGETLVHLTQAGAVMGSPPTMAPEQFDDPERVDYRADIYGLGCVLYHLLTGELAFPATNLTLTISSKMQAQGPDPRRLRPELPVEVSRLVRRMIAKDPADRPQSYGELVIELERLARVCRGTRPQRGPRAPRSRALLAGGALLVVAGVAAGLALLRGGAGEGDEPSAALSGSPAPVAAHAALDPPASQPGGRDAQAAHPPESEADAIGDEGAPGEARTPGDAPAPAGARVSVGSGTSGEANAPAAAIVTGEADGSDHAEGGGEAADGSSPPAAEESSGAAGSEGSTDAGAHHEPPLDGLADAPEAAPSEAQRPAEGEAATQGASTEGEASATHEADAEPAGDAPAAGDEAAPAGPEPATEVPGLRPALAASEERALLTTDLHDPFDQIGWEVDAGAWEGTREGAGAIGLAPRDGLVEARYRLHAGDWSLRGEMTLIRRLVGATRRTALRLELGEHRALELELARQEDGGLRARGRLLERSAEGERSWRASDELPALDLGAWKEQRPVAFELKWTAGVLVLAWGEPDDEDLRREAIDPEERGAGAPLYLVLVVESGHGRFEDLVLQGK